MTGKVNYRRGEKRKETEQYVEQRVTRQDGTKQVTEASPECERKERHVIKK